MLTMEMRLDDERWRGEQKGLKQGLAEGIQQGILLADAQTARNLQKRGWKAEQIAAVLETTPEKVEELLKYPMENIGSSGNQ